MALLGEAFVRVRPDTDGFEKEASGKIGGGLKRVAGAVVSAFGAIKVGGFLKDAIGEASDYGETVSKSANVFGAKLAPAIQKFAATAPKAFGISEVAALGATAQFGNMFKQLGFTGEAAGKASTNLIKTAADLGSFNNVDPTDVLERIGGALRGEFDSLQQLIPNINATRVANEAMAATGKKTADSLTAQEKATATLAIIQKDGALAANDFAETSGGLANQQRILSATVDTLKRRLGEEFLPIATKVTTYLAANAEPAFNAIGKAVTVFMDAFMGRSELNEFDGKLRTLNNAGIRTREVIDTIRTGATVFFDALRGRSELNEFDGGLRTANNAGIKMRDTFAKVKKSVSDAIKQVREGNTELPSFSGLLDVGAGALRLVADNADLVVKALPFLVAGFLLVKTAQSAANIVALASLPLRAAEIAANFALASANKALAFQLAAVTGVQRVGIVSRIASTVATVAGTVATTAATAASKVFAAAQIVVNAVLAANPIGLVVLALAGLVAGLVFAYKNSETFRNIVKGALDVVKTSFLTLGTTALGIFDKMLAGFQAVASAAGKLPGPLGAPFRAAAEAIGKAREGVQGLQGKLEGLKSKDVTVNANTAGAVADVQSVASRVAALKDKTITIRINEVVRKGQQATGRGLQERAGGGPVSARTPYLVGEREPEVFVPDTSGRILNQRQLRSALADRAGGPGNTYNVSFAESDPARVVALLRQMELLDA